jgi:hypothetical protein
MTDEETYIGYPVLTEPEQGAYREEIDYLIQTHGYEYVWGQETAMDKTKGLLREAPATIIGGLQKLASNPTVIGINEKLKAHAQKINAQDAERGQSEPLMQPRRNQKQGKHRHQPPEPSWRKGFNLDGDDHL